MTIGFKVNGNPFGKQRPRFSRYGGHTYTPKETVDKEKEIASEYVKNFGTLKFNDDDVLKMTITAFMRIPKSTAKKNIELMKKGDIRPSVKPDWDNIGKLVSDALNGVAYKDDKQIASAIIHKYYSDEPCTVIEIENV